MKKKLAAFLAMMMALVTMSSAAMAEEETPTITAHKANAITIDGDLSDWDLSSPAVLEDASQIIRDLSFWQGRMICPRRSTPRMTKRTCILPST